MYLLPKENPATKKIMESPVMIPCDIYTGIDNENTKQQIDDFMKFIETHINKIRKTPKASNRVSHLIHYNNIFISKYTKVHFTNIFNYFLC